MSHERLFAAGNSADQPDPAAGSAATERDCANIPAPPPSRGAALSVLWWSESEDDDAAAEQRPETD
jgi:hypothetical protein